MIVVEKGELSASQKKAGAYSGQGQAGGARSRSHAKTMSHKAVFSNDTQRVNGRCLDRNAPGD